jgi:hypothetical protein
MFVYTQHLSTYLNGEYVSPLFLAPAVLEWWKLVFFVTLQLDKRIIFIQLQR